MASATRGPLRLAMAGGGTGGHIVPGLNLLGHMRGTRALGDLLWFGSGRAVERAALARLEECAGPAPLERVTLRLEPPGGGAPSAALLARRLAPEVVRARRALRRHGSEVLLGLGGFTALPPVLAARSLGIPIALLEVNTCPGRATRFLGPLARRVFHAWRTSVPTGSKRHRWSGPPLDPAWLEPVAPGAERSARAALGFDPERPLLVVVGGSQGSSALNAFVVRERDALLSGTQVLHQTGPGRRREGAPEVPGYRAVEYLDDVRTALVAATLVLCRGGASTLAEVGASGCPAWVVPYPHHPDHHQEHNARELGDGVRIVPESRLDTGLARDLARLAGPAGRAQRHRMSQALTGRVPPDAAIRLFEELLALRG